MNCQQTLIFPKLFIFILIIVLSRAVLGKNNSTVQIDLIVFAHHYHKLAPQLFANNDQKNITSGYNTIVSTSNNWQGIKLHQYSQGDTIHKHNLLVDASRLQSNYLKLKHAAQFRVLLHYSWLQPIDNQQAVILPTVVQNDWKLESLIKVRKMNYYFVEINLLFSSFNNQTTLPLIFSQRVKSEHIYYLDHPYLGILITIAQPNLV